MPEYRSVKEWEDALNEFMAGPTFQEKLEGLEPYQREALGATGILAAYQQHRLTRAAKLNEFLKSHGTLENIRSLKFTRKDLGLIGGNQEEEIHLTPKEALDYSKNPQIQAYLYYRQDELTKGTNEEDLLHFNEFRDAGTSSINEWNFYMAEARKRGIPKEKLLSPKDFWKEVGKARVTPEEAAAKAGAVKTVTGEVGRKQTVVAQFKSPNLIADTEKNLRKTIDVTTELTGYMTDKLKDLPKEEQTARKASIEREFWRDRVNTDIATQLSSSVQAGDFKTVDVAMDKNTGKILYWVVDRGTENEFNVQAKQ